MRPHAAGILLLTVLASCARPTPRQASTTADADVIHPSESSVRIAPAAPSTTSTVASATPRPADTSPTPSEAPTSEARSPDVAAKDAINALINPNPTTPAGDKVAWHDVLTGGQIIQTTVLAQAASRATIAISIAFPATPVGETSEPIGLRVELVRPDSLVEWSVIAIGYL